jgi:hypothetical protein
MYSYYATHLLNLVDYLLGYFNPVETLMHTCEPGELELNRLHRWQLLDPAFAIASVPPQEGPNHIRVWTPFRLVCIHLTKESTRSALNLENLAEYTLLPTFMICCMLISRWY